MEPLQSQSVAIAGHKVRRIREEKRLTQLYVAKVVGVTTDTVSRWENNRYPTIRRDNALKLAEALEVELETLLLEDSSGEDPVPERGSGCRRLWLLAAVVLLLLGLLTFFYAYWQNHQALPILQAKRVVPPYAAPGTRILVRVEINSETGMKGMILKEQFAPGWRLLDAEPPAASVSSQAQGARWIFRNPPPALTVYYMLETATDVGNDTEPFIQGEVIANPNDKHFAQPVTSNGKMLRQPFHWADSNANYVIDDLEILEVSEMTDATGGLALGWDQLEDLWEGEGYRWLPQTHEFEPLPGPLD
jgi:transcriptional regulator with XRE-family HTH domain